VLNHAAGCRDHRVVGHAANAEFWIAEINYCLAVIDGFSQTIEA